MNLNEFLSSIGHAAPVWSSFGLCAALMAAEVFRLRQRLRSARIRVTHAPGVPQDTAQRLGAEAATPVWQGQQ